MPSRITVRGRAPREGEIGPNAAEREAMFTRGGTTPPPGNLRPAQEIFRAIRDLQNAPGSADRAQEIVIQAAALLGGMGLPGISQAAPGATASGGGGLAAGGAGAAAGGGAMASAMNALARAIEGSTRASGGGGFANPAMLSLISARWSQGPSEKMDPLLRRIDRDVRAIGTGAGGGAPPAWVPPGLPASPSWPGPGAVPWPPGMGTAQGGAAAPGAAPGGAPGWATPAARMRRGRGAPGGGGGGGGAGDVLMGAAAEHFARRMPATSRIARMLGLGAGGAAAAEGGAEAVGLAIPGLDVVAATAGAGFLIYEAGKEIISLVKGAVTAPQKAAGTAAAVLASAMPWYDFQIATARYGITGGFPGGALRGQLYSGLTAPSAMGARLGLSPQEMLGLASNYSIVQRTPEAAARLIETLGASRFAPGLSTLPTGLVQSSILQAQTYGAGAIQSGPLGAASATAQFADAMQKAVAAGLNQAEVMKNINAGISYMASIGATSAVSPSQVFGWEMQFRGAGPGGPTGLLGLQNMQGLTSATALIGHAPLQTMLASRIVRTFTSMGAVQKFVEAHGKPGTWEAMNATPTQRAALKYMVNSAASGGAFGVLMADQEWQSLMLGHPGLMAATLNIPRAPGQSEAENAYLNWQIGHYKSFASAVAAENPPPPLSVSVPYMLANYPSYLSGLKGTPLSAADQQAQMRMGKLYGVDPRVLATLEGVESSFGKNPKAGFNVMQISSPNPMPTTREQSIAEGAQIFSKRLKEGGGNLEAALIGYNEGTIAEQAFLKTGAIDTRGEAYLNKFYEMSGQVGGLQTALKNRALAGSLPLGVAQLNAAEFGQVLADVAGALTTLAAEITSAAGVVGKASSEAPSRAPWK